MRPHIAAVYAFARTADDFADEGRAPADVRIAQLDDWAHRLHEAAAGRPPKDDEHQAVFVAIAETIRSCGLDVGLFDDLLSAFRQDVTTTRYETWEELLDYCRRSASPIGRLVLRVAGYREPALAVASDAVCTALQLTNFWQDLERDWMKGRLYVPLSLVRAHGADERDLERREMSPAWRAVLAEVVARTRTLFRSGRSVADGVSGRLRWELRATWLGGARILDRLEAANFDGFRQRPTLGFGDALPLVWRTLRWKAGTLGHPAIGPLGQ